jgi:hypothetical protein
MELEVVSSCDVFAVLPRSRISPIRSKNSTPTVTISRIARLSLQWQGPPHSGQRRRYFLNFFLHEGQ